MELKDFIKAAITDITEAVSDLQGELKNGAVVSPSMPAPISLKTLKQDGKNRLISNVDFDVALTIGNVDTIEGHAGLGLLQVFSAKVDGGNESKTEHISRIRFSIPVIYPTAMVKTESEEQIQAAKNQLHNKNPRHHASKTEDNIPGSESNLPCDN